MPALAAAAANGVQADVTDDLQALREAALQTTKPVAATDAVADTIIQPVAAQDDSSMQSEQVNAV